MKKLFLLTVFILGLGQIHAQITLTSADCTLSPPDTVLKNQILNPDSVLVPTEGPDQYWDYSQLQLDLEADLNSSAFFAVTDDTVVNMATAGLSGGTSPLPGLVVPRTEYYQNDENGKYFLGWLNSAVEFPLTAITGNPEDKLNFIASPSIFETPHIYIEYPASFGDKWESDHGGSLNWETTAGAFGLDAAPTTGKSDCHQEGEVVGWGTLKLPNFNGGAPYEVEALLVKTVETCIDSFFLFGQSAPPAFLGAFGQVQGQSSTNTTYEFYIRGLKSEALFIATTQNEVTISNEVVTGKIPLTLTSADCTLSPPDTVIMKEILDPGSVLDPTEGPDQYWNYSSLEVDPRADMRTEIFTPVTGDSVFTTATAGLSGGTSPLPGLVVPRFEYFQNDENGKSYLGWISEPVEFPLGAITGNPEDKLNFAASTSIFETPHINIEYPASLGRKWDSDYSGSLNWETSAGAFGLAAAPTSATSYCHQEGEVVGWGTLRLPNSNGGAPTEVEALLIKTVETCIDSFFLFGQSAPPAFLGAFGQVQGQSYTNTTYEFYIKGAKSEVLYIHRSQGGNSEVLLSSEFDPGTGMTLERSDFIAEEGLSLFRAKVDPDSVPVYMPTEGPNQVWDYTGLSIIGSDTLTLEPNNDPAFPDADIFTQRETLQGAGNLAAVFDRSNYYILNDTAYASVGVKFGPVGIPLEALTGSSTDSLNFIENFGQYPNNPGYLAWFPMNYGDDQRSSDYVVDNNTLLTASPFQLDQVPTLNRVIGSSTHEVAGWGKLSLKNPADQSIVSLDALLMKTVTVEVDSFYLGGAPMPPPLLAAFGVTQGGADTSATYRFYAKGFPDAVLSLCSCSTSWVLSDWEFLSLVNSTQDGIDHSIAFKYYPNPATDQLNLEFEKSTNEPWMFSLYNSLGQKVYDHKITQAKGRVNEHISFNRRLNAGHYFYVLHNEGRRILSSGGLQMK